MNGKNDQKTEYLDLLRWLAIGMVVLLHVASGIVDTIPGQMTAKEQTMYELVKNVMTVGVPIFLMISGSLFLDPKKEIGIQRMLTHYVLRIVVVLFLFGVPYAVMELIVQEGGFAPMMLIRGFFLTLSGNTWAHMWYLYELVGIYLLTPFIKAVIHYGGKCLLEYGLALSFLFFSILPLVERVLGSHVGLVYQLNGIYLFYYVLGYYLHSYGTMDWKWCAGLFVILEGVICANRIMGFQMDIQYHAPIIVVASASLFLLFRNLKKENACLSKRRYLCFGIYLIHTLFLNAFYKAFHFTPLAFGAAGILLFWILVFGLSILASEMMHRMPVLKKFI